MHSIKEIFDDIVLLADVIEDNGIDTYRIQKGIETEEITKWEESNEATLPEGYKEFIALANGFSYRNTQIYPLGGITTVDVPEEFKGYYLIGSYIGDGSMILSDKYGNFCFGDHVFGVEQGDFAKFLEDYILCYMKEDLQDNGVAIPDNLNTKETEEEIREREAEVAIMLEKLKALREKQ